MPDNPLKERKRERIREENKKKKNKKNIYKTFTLLFCF